MKIAYIGPGIMPIPPRGWGAVELLISEYAEGMKRLGWDVLIVNTRDRVEIARLVNEFAPDFVHCHYDEMYDVMPAIACPHKAITSHFGYLDQVWCFKDYLTGIHEKIAGDSDLHIFALSQSIRDVYAGFGVPESRLHVVPNGTDIASFRRTSNPAHKERSICLAKVDFRKRQGLVQAVNANVDFAGVLGPLDNIQPPFDPADETFLGEWTRDRVKEALTDYANLVLLSDGEAHPLVCMEALAAGLGLVISEFATANLDTTKPFITVVPEALMDDAEHLRAAIEDNRRVSVAMRQEIFDYAQTFDWSARLLAYERLVRNIIAAPNIDSRPPFRARRLAVITVATGAYFGEFFVDFQRTVQREFSRIADVTIYCFTDQQTPDLPGIQLRPCRKTGWPFDSLLRFSLMRSIEQELLAFDNIMFLDADMTAEATPDRGILDAQYFAVTHPGYFSDEQRKTAPFEIDPVSSAYFEKTPDTIYYQGCCFGGQRCAFLFLVRTLDTRIRRDLDRGDMPVWHDESYLNWFLARVPVQALHPGYSYPELFPVPFPKVILHRAKAHHTIRGHVSRLGGAVDRLGGADPNDLTQIYRLLFNTAHQKTQSLEAWFRDLESSASALRSSMASAQEQILHLQAANADRLLENTKQAALIDTLRSEIMMLTDERDLQATELGAARSLIRSLNDALGAQLQREAKFFDKPWLFAALLMRTLWLRLTRVVRSSL